MELRKLDYADGISRGRGPGLGRFDGGAAAAENEVNAVLIYISLGS